MRLRHLFLPALLASLIALPATAQTPPADAPSSDLPVRVVDATPDELTWEELPEQLRELVEPLLGHVPGQAVLHVDTAVTPDTDFRPVDHGDLLIVQSVRPAGVARITRPVREFEKYGPMDALLWPGIGPEGDYWCWRRDNPATSEPEGNIYCYHDRDNDGVSDKLMENDVWFATMHSRFQFNILGHDERVRDRMSYTVTEGAIGPFEELIAVQYEGVISGMVTDDGMIAPGRLRLNIVVGPDRDRLTSVKTVTIALDQEGRGSYYDPNGIRIEVEGVRLNGVARMKVLSGMPLGRGLLLAPHTRENVLTMMSDLLNADGSFKSQGAPAPSAE